MSRHRPTGISIVTDECDYCDRTHQVRWPDVMIRVGGSAMAATFRCPITLRSYTIELQAQVANVAIARGAILLGAKWTSRDDELFRAEAA